MNKSYVPFVGKILLQFNLYQASKKKRLKKHKNYQKRQKGFHGLWWILWSKGKISLYMKECVQMQNNIPHHNLVLW